MKKAVKTTAKRKAQINPRVYDVSGFTLKIRRKLGLKDEGDIPSEPVDLLINNIPLELGNKLLERVLTAMQSPEDYEKLLAAI